MIMSVSHTHTHVCTFRFLYIAIQTQMFAANKRISNVTILENALEIYYFH